MFPQRYFPDNYFPRRYFPEAAHDPALATGVPRIFATSVALGAMASSAGPRSYGIQPGAFQELKAGGGGGGYTAKAVHFDGVATLQIAAISTIASTPLILSSHWQKIALANWHKPDVPAIWVTDPLAQYQPNFSLDETAVSNLAQIDFNPGDPTSGSFCSFNSSASPVAGVGGWQHFLMAAKVDAAAGLKLAKIYLNDVDITNTSVDVAAAYNIQMNGFLFCVGSDAGFDTPLVGDLADLRVVLGYNPFVAGDLPVAFRRLFIDGSGKPVDPATATATVGAGIVLCSGDASAGGFQLNQGTGGAFTLAGSLTNAATSPSD